MTPVWSLGGRDPVLVTDTVAIAQCCLRKALQRPGAAVARIHVDDAVAKANDAFFAPGLSMSARDESLPGEQEEVVGLHIAPGSLSNQVGIFDRPKNQISGSCCVDAARP